VAGRERLIPGSGVNLEYFAPLEYPPEEVLHFVFIGRIMQEKGVEQYLEAARYIRDKYKNTVFHVVGSCEEKYEDLLKDLMVQGIIRFHGRLDDVRPIYKMCHCTVHPTFYPEGLSNVLLESAACGRPVITTDRSGCREVVDAGGNGFLVKEKDSGSIIEAIGKFILLPYQEKKQMGLAGRAKVEKEFDRRIVVEAYLQEIDQICSEEAINDK
jgi:galacturonosyltransferase